MDESATNRQVAALKAIIQTVLPDLYWTEEDDRESYFRRAVEDADPIAMAIAKELTEEEITGAFAWCGAGSGFEGPVAKYLSEEQRKRIQIRMLSEDAAEAAIEEAMRSGAGTEKRLKMAKQRYIERMREDVRGRDGALAEPSRGAMLEDEVSAFPEEWRRRMRKELEAMGRRLRSNEGGEHPAKTS